MKTEELKIGDKVIWYYDEDDAEVNKAPFIGEIIRFDSGDGFDNWLILKQLRGYDDPGAYSYNPKYAKKVTDEEVMLWKLSN